MIIFNGNRNYIPICFFSFRMPIYFTLKVRIIPLIESELKISFETHSWHTKIFHNFFGFEPSIISWNLLVHLLALIKTQIALKYKKCNFVLRSASCLLGFLKVLLLSEEILLKVHFFVQTLRFDYLYCTILPNLEH